MKRSAGDALQHCPIGALELTLARMIPIDARAHTNDVATHLTTLNRCCACRTDLPERLQIDMADRSLVKTLDDVRAEARWMVLKSKEIKWLWRHFESTPSQLTNGSVGSCFEAEGLMQPSAPTSHYQLLSLGASGCASGNIGWRRAANRPALYAPCRKTAPHSRRAILNATPGRNRRRPCLCERPAS